MTLSVEHLQNKKLSAKLASEVDCSSHATILQVCGRNRPTTPIPSGIIITRPVIDSKELVDVQWEEFRPKTQEPFYRIDPIKSDHAQAGNTHRDSDESSNDETIAQVVLSGERYLPGEQVFFALNGDEETNILEVVLHPVVQPLVSHVWRGVYAQVKLKSIAPHTTYECVLDRQGQPGRSLGQHSTSEVTPPGSLWIRLTVADVQILQPLMNDSIIFVPEMKGQYGGLCTLSIDSKDRVECQFVLPWGTALMAHLKGEGSPVVSKFEPILWM